MFRVLTAIVTIIRSETSSIKNLLGWVLTAISFSIEDIKGYLSILVLLLTISWWAIRIYKQLNEKEDDSNK